MRGEVAGHRQIVETPPLELEVRHLVRDVHVETVDHALVFERRIFKGGCEVYLHDVGERGAQFGINILQRPELGNQMVLESGCPVRRLLEDLPELFRETHLEDHVG